MNEVNVSPYEEWEKRIINGNIENVTYHPIDWDMVFGVKPQNAIVLENAEITVYTSDELLDRYNNMFPKKKNKL